MPQFPTTATTVAAINKKFADGAAAAQPERCGVFVSQFDIMHDASSPWLPCAPRPGAAWCWWLSDRLSGSVINAHAPHLYSASLGGMIISASAVRLRCAFSADGGTQGEDRACPIAGVPPSEQLGGVWWDGDDCVPGCSVKGGRPQWCHGLGDYSGCAWEPRSLELMLQQQAKGGLKEQYNEVVFDPAPITAGLPTSIEAFFFQPGSSWQDRERVRNAWQAFKRRYRGATTPLLQYDPAQGSRDSHDAFSQFG